MSKFLVNGIFQAEIYFKGKKGPRYSLGTGLEKVAEDAYKGMEGRKRQLQRKEVRLPPDVSVWDFIYEGRTEPSVVAAASTHSSVTIHDLLKAYRPTLGPPGISESFARTQGLYLAHFARFLKKPPVDLPDLIAEWKAKHIEAYRCWRLGKQGRNSRGQPVRVVTVDKEVGTLRRMFDYAVREEWLEENPVRNLKVIPDDTPDDEWLTSEEVAAKIKTGSLAVDEAAELRRRLVLDADEVEDLKELAWEMSDKYSIYRRGDLALIIHIAADTGARIDEIFRLAKKDITLSVASGTGSITVRSRKQRKNRVWTPRTIPIEGDLVERLSRWLAGTSRAKLFAEKNANTFRKRVYEMLDLVTAGSPFHGIRPHLLRHACRTNWQQGEMDESIIDRYLGHTTKAMSERYSHLREKWTTPQVLSYRKKVAEERAKRRAAAGEGAGVQTATISAPVVETGGDSTTALADSFHCVMAG